MLQKRKKNGFIREEIKVGKVKNEIAHSEILQNFFE